MLLFFVGLGQATVKAQVTSNPACNVTGPLIYCANMDTLSPYALDTLYVEVSNSTNSLTLDYTFGSNSSGARIMFDYHGNVEGGGDSATSTGVFDPNTNMTYDTLVVYIGDKGTEFNVQVNVTNRNVVNNTAECSKSVTVINFAATVAAPPVLCYGGTSVVTVNGIGGNFNGYGNSLYYDSLFTSTTNLIDYKNDINQALTSTDTFQQIPAGTYIVHILTPPGNGNCYVKDTFTITQNPKLTLSCPGNDVVGSCQTADQVGTEYANWLASTTVGGGTGIIHQSNNSANLPAPSACGGTTTVTFTATDSCTTLTCQASFTVTAAPKVVLTCPQSQTVTSCQTQTAVTNEFNAWLATASVSGGCRPVLSNNSTTPPAACGGSATVVFTATDYCNATQTCSATFTVTPAPVFTLTPPQSTTVTSCQTQTAVTNEFNAWLATASVSGGCSPVLSNNSTTPPAACGGSATVVFTVTDYCNGTQTASATFTVTPAPAFTLTCAPNQTVASCQTQEAVTTAFNAWVASASVSGGCSPVLTNDVNSDHHAPAACGGATTIIFSATDYCNANQTCSATFTVTPAPVFTLTPPQSTTVTSCQTQTAVTNEFNAWLATASVSGGCSPVLSNNSTTPPAACGGSATVVFTVTDYCNGTQTASATFTVTPAPPFVLTAPTSQTTASCQTEAAVEAAFQTWLNSGSVSGGCSPVLGNNNNSDNPNGGAPAACGGTTTIIFTATDYCNAPQTASASFTVTPAPVFTLTPPQSTTVTSCQTQTAVTNEFNAWLATASVSGGCSPVLSNNSTTPPAACGGSATVVFTVTDYCNGTQTASATFTVTPAPPFVLTAPTSQTTASCQTEAAVEAAFQTWLNSGSVSGGCSPVLSNNNNSDNPNGGAPAACGGTTTIIFSATDYCNAPQTASASFTVTPAPVFTLTPPQSTTVTSCQTQTAVTNEFNAWLATASVSGGCSPVLGNNSTVPPAACGGSATVVFTVTDYCNGTQTASATFTVTPAPPFVLTDAANTTEPSCQTQDAVTAAFNAWLATASVSGGCSPVLTNDNNSDHRAPSACGGATTIIFTATDYCNATQTARATFTVTPAPKFTLTAPQSETVTSCQTQDAVTTEFNAWLATASVSGGCSPVLSNNSTVPPAACGGSATVVFTVTDYCNNAQTASATFTVTPAPPFVLTAPTSQSTAACQTQDAVDAAYQAWLASGSVSGGCSPVLGNNNNSDNSNGGAPSACGGSTTIIFTATDYCNAPQTASATFTVAAPAPMVLTCAQNLTVASCQTSDAVLAAYNAWLATASVSGGCSPVLNNNNPGVPAACGGSTTVIFTATDICAGTQTCSATFTVTPAPAMTFTPASNLTVNSCQTQDAVDAAFQTWLNSASVSGGCSPVLGNNNNSDNSNGGAPAACGGSTTIIFTVTDYCNATQTASATFTVTPAPAFTLTGAQNQTAPACQTQSAVDASFQSWLASASVSGGCSPVLSNNNNSDNANGGAPSSCGGATTIIFTATDYCNATQTASATFTVTTPAAMVLTCAQNQTVTSCQTQDAVTAEFNTWLATASVSGGCSPVLSNNSSVPPAACGGSTTVIFTATDVCLGTQTCSATFTVTPAIQPVLAAPSDTTIASCQTQANINSAYASWLNGASVTGGCNSYLTNNTTTTTCVTYQQGPKKAIGAELDNLYYPTENFDYTTYDVFAALQWTNGGIPVEIRGLLQYDLSQIPAGSTIVSAKLSLYAADSLASNSYNGEPTYGSNNACELHQVTSPWNPATVTWNTQPTASNTNVVSLPQSTNYDENYLNLDVSNFVQGWVNNPSSNDGMLLKIITQNHYNAMVFASPSYVDSTLWPKLDICYIAPGAVSGNGPNAPAACGGTVTVTFSDTSSCYTPQTANATFTVTPAPTMVLTCAQNQTVTSCQTQDAITAEFNTWLATASVSGGCSPVLVNNSTVPPAACGGTTTVTFTATDNCGGTQTCSATFTVSPAPQLIFTPASNLTVNSCQTQDAIDAAFQTWLNSASVSGGCSPILGNNNNSDNANGGAPAACGGSTTVIFTVNDICSTQTASATFTVTPAPAMVFTPATSQTVNACQTQDEVDAEYQTWLNSASVSGGCSPVLGNNNNSDNSNGGAPSACGGSTTIIFTATDYCNGTQTASATFTVTTPAPMVLTCAQNTTVASCQTSDAVLSAYNAWLATASVSGGCSPVLNNNNPGVPAACGGSTTVIFTATDICAAPQTCSATFTVTRAPAMTFTPASNLTVNSCQTQDAIDVAFQTWLNSASVSGGCSPVLGNNNNSDNSNGGAPSACGGSTTIIFTVTDYCNATQTASATFTVTPAPALVFTPATNQTVNSCQTQSAVDAEFQTWLNSASVSGGCSPILGNNNNSDNANGGAPSACGGATTIIFTVTDICSGTQTASATFTVPSTTPPVLTCAQNQTVASCQTQGEVASEYATWLATASVSGGCSPVLNNNSTGAPLACGGTVTVTFTATNTGCYSGTPQTCSASFTVSPAPKLSINAQNATEASCQTQQTVNAAYANWLNNVTATGGCSPTITNNCTGQQQMCGGKMTSCTPPAACGGSSTVIFTASDACGHTATASATFTVSPAPAVVLNAQSTSTASCQTQTAVNAAYASWLAGVSATGGCGTITITDNCSGGIQWNCGGRTTSCSAPSACGGSSTVIFKATDACGHTATASATFTVPAAANSLEVNAQNSTTTSCQTQTAVNAAYATWLNSITATGGCGTITITDNCTGTQKMCGNTMTSCTPPSSCGGSSTVIFTATDACGHTATASATFTVPAGAKLVLSSQNSTTTSCQTQTAVNAAYANWLNSISATGGCGTITITDNCNGGTQWNCGGRTTSCTAPSACGGSSTVIFTATDACGHTATSSSTFTVPASSSSLEVSVQNSSTPSCQTQTAVNAAYANWLNSVTANGGCGTITITDNCTGTQKMCGNTMTSCTPPASCGGSSTVTFKATDACGHTATASATFTVLPSGAPTITKGASNLTLNCATSSSASLSGWLASNGGATVTDNCSSVTWSNNYCGHLPSACNGSVGVTFTATDGCGNTATTSASITVTSTTPPIITPATNYTISGTSSGGSGCSNNCKNICGSSWGSGWCNNWANSSCGSWCNSNSCSWGWGKNSCNTNTCSNGGNSSTCSITNWLASNGGATVTSSCTSVTWTNNYNGAVPTCNSSVCVTFTATDACGNKATTVGCIEVSGTTPPTITKAACNLTLSCSSSAASSVSSWLASNGGATATGSSTITWSNNYSGNLPTGCSASVSVTFTASDACGNTATTKASITVNDNTPPSITKCASNLSLSCSSSCPNAISSWLSSNGGACATDNCSSVTWSNNYNGQTPSGCNGSVCVTFTASDACGNTSTTKASINVTDNTPPTITKCASNGSTACSSSSALSCWLGSNGGATATDNCSSVTWSNNYNANSCSGSNMSTITVTFTASDACGNTATTKATFTITSSTPPTMSCACNLTVPCGSAVCFTAPTVNNNGNSGVTVTVIANDSVTNGDGSKSYTRVWELADACGDVSTCSQIITVSACSSSCNQRADQTAGNGSTPDEMPSAISKFMAYPNPAQADVNFSMTFGLDMDNVTLEIFDLNGQRVGQLFNGSVTASQDYHFTFDVSVLAAGTYYYRLNTPNGSNVDKIIILH